MLYQIFPLDKFGFWYFYAYQDIKNKYSRSVLGPLWVSFSVAVTIFAMGPLYGGLFGAVDYKYYLYLATGIVSWYYISGTLGESATAFTAHEVFIKQTNIPLSAYVLRICIRNLLILFHNLIVLMLVYVWVNGFDYKIFLIIPLLIEIFTLLYFSAIVLAFFCARFRDLIPLVSNFLQLAMFLTPIFWMVSSESNRSVYTQLNPFYYLVSAFRAPFGIGEITIKFQLILFLGIWVIGALALSIIRKFSKRVVYWV